MDFVEYLEKKKAQKRIDKLAKKYSDKKIILYGAGLFVEIIFQNYDLSKLNIIAIADRKFNYTKEFHGLEIVDPSSLQDRDFDVLLISTYKDFATMDYFEDDLFRDFRPKFKIDSLIKMSFWEYVRNV